MVTIMYHHYYNIKCAPSPNAKYSCVEGLECSGTSAFLRGCDTFLVYPPTPQPFPGIIDPTPREWPIDPIQYKCRNFTINSKNTQFFCENYCDPSLYINNNRPKECSGCNDNSCTFEYNSFYTKRLDCIGNIVQLISGPEYDCSYYYSKNNTCNSIVIDPDVSYGFRQCILTLSNECVAVKNLYKLPEVL